MYKLLLATNQGVVFAGLSSLIKGVIKDVDQHLASSLSEAQGKLDINNYDMLVYSLPINKPTPIDALLDIIKLYPSLAVLLLSENTNLLPLQKLYSAGICGIIDKKVSLDKLQKMIGQVYANCPMVIEA